MFKIVTNSVYSWRCRYLPHPIAVLKRRTYLIILNDRSCSDVLLCKSTFYNVEHPALMCESKIM